MTGWPRALAWRDFAPVHNPAPGELVARNGRPIVARVGVSIQLVPGNSGRAVDGCSFRTVDVRVVAESLVYVPSRVPRGEDDYYLRHEQGHLDLMGLFARELELALLGLHAATSDELTLLARAAVDRAVADARSYAINTPQSDCLYDRETQHAMDRARQGEWNARIARNVARWQRPDFLFRTD